MNARSKVLVVDDDEDLRRLTRKRLEDLYDVVEANSGAAAIEAVSAQHPDLVLLDVMMPGMNGIDACARIKASTPDAFLPVLLLTALEDQSNRNKGLEAGADDYLAKPIDMVELKHRVRHFLKLREQDQLIRRQVAELNRLSALREDLTSMMVHDLRNPLVGVIGALQFMQMSTLSKDDRDMVDLGASSAQRVMELIDDLLRIRMLEDAGLTASREPRPVAEIVHAAVRSVAPAAQASGVALNVKVVDVVAPLDGKLLQRALENLLVNAVRHTRGSIDVDVTADNNRVLIDVADRGPGVPDALKPGMFEKYGSVEMKNAKARRGHGLGLYLVGLVMQAHGGKVEVLDRDGGGALFRLVLPAR